MAKSMSVENEINRLLTSPYVKLAKKEEAVRCRLMQYVDTLRAYENKGKSLAKSGVTMGKLMRLEEEFDDLFGECGEGEED